MLALNIPELKNFMNQLLCSDTFDHFLLKEATIQKDAVWNFDGTVTPDFYPALRFCPTAECASTALI